MTNLHTDSAREDESRTAGLVLASAIAISELIDAYTRDLRCHRHRRAWPDVGSPVRRIVDQPSIAPRRGDCYIGVPFSPV